MLNGITSTQQRHTNRFRELAEQIDARFAAADERFGRIDQRFSRIDQRLEAMDGKLDTVVDLLRDR